MPAAVAALSIGCLRYHPTPISATRNADDIEARTLDDPDLRSFLTENLDREIAPWPPASWDLTTLTLAAFYYQPELDVARAQWGVAQGGVITAGGRPNPTANLEPEYVPNSEASSPWILGLTLNIPIETFRKRGYRIARARSLSEAARLEIGAVAWEVRSRVRSSLLDLSAAQKRAALEGDRLATEEARVRLLERRLEVGEAATPDVTLERVELEAARLAVRDAEQKRAEARARLAAAIGVPLHALVGVKLSFDALEGPLPTPADLSVRELRRQALIGRADVRSALAQYAAAESALRLEIASQYPDVRLGPGFTWEQGENHYTLGFSAALPILNRNRGPIAEAEARRKEQAARFTALQAHVIGDLDRALAGYRAASDAVAAASAAFERRAEHQRQVRSAFEAGEVDHLALLGADLETALAEISRNEALTRQRVALGLLEDSVQRPLFDSSSTLVPPEGDPRAGAARP